MVSDRILALPDEIDTLVAPRTGAGPRIICSRAAKEIFFLVHIIVFTLALLDLILKKMTDSAFALLPHLTVERHFSHELTAVATFS